ncbi:hypothetical protein [Microbacterium sp. NPDC058345]|uniref:hypothetical protein n=1 Tax=Microbacterium sp. NPDC058345 TaxID=3346455 RepID=UPI00365E3116
MRPRPTKVAPIESAPGSPWRPALKSAGIAAGLWATYPVGIVLGMVAAFLPLLTIVPFLAPFALVAYTSVLAVRTVEHRRLWPIVTGFLGALATSGFAIFYAVTLGESVANLGG